MAQVEYTIVGLPFLFIKSPFSFLSSPLSILSSRSDHAMERLSLALRSHTLKSFHSYFSLCFSSPHQFTTGNYSNNSCCINESMAQRVYVIVTRII